MTLNPSENRPQNPHVDSSGSESGMSPASGNASSQDAEVFARLLSGRYSCRGFLPEQVPRATIVRILEMSQRTASWCNSQPWKVVIASGAAIERFRDALYSHVSAGAQEASDFPFPREYRGEYLNRRRECGFQLYNTLGIARGDKAAYNRQFLENYRLFGAPHVAIITTDEALGVYGVLDCGAYVSNFVLAARSLGVAAIAQAAIAGQSPFVRAHFKLPEDRRVVCGISFGFEDQSHPANRFRTTRAGLDETVTWKEEP
jgi:nitroreductase